VGKKKKERRNKSPYLFFSEMTDENSHVGENPRARTWRSGWLMRRHRFAEEAQNWETQELAGWKSLDIAVCGII